MRRSTPSVNASSAPDDVVSVEPEVEREVVSRPGRHADLGDVMLHRDRRHQRLRPVTSRHPDDVGPVLTARLARSQRSSPGPSSSGSMLLFLASSGRLKALGLSVHLTWD